MNAEWICLAVGPLITLAVSAFKRWQFPSQHPKVVAFLLSTLFGVVSSFTYMDLDWKALATCILVPFWAAVATFEVVKNS